MTVQQGLIGFYADETPDLQGRFRPEILAWPDDELEAVHDYIQWLFPLRARSPVNPSAPVVTDAVVAEFHRRAKLRGNLRESYQRMLRFYQASSHHWLTPNNHNHLRITRILTCLRTLGLPDEADEFFAWLRAVHEANPGCITAVSFRFWTRAAGG